MMVDRAARRGQHPSTCASSCGGTSQMCLSILFSFIYLSIYLHPSIASHAEQRKDENPGAGALERKHRLVHSPHNSQQVAGTGHFHSDSIPDFPTCAVYHSHADINFTVYTHTLSTHGLISEYIHHLRTRTSQHRAPVC